MSGMLGDTLLSFLRIMGVLAAVLGLAYLILQKGLAKFLVKKSQGRLIQIRERMPLDSKRTLYVVDVSNRSFLIGGSDQNLSLLAELSQEVDQA